MARGNHSRAIGSRLDAEAPSILEKLQRLPEGSAVTRAIGTNGIREGAR